MNFVIGIASNFSKKTNEINWINAECISKTYKYVTMIIIITTIYNIYFITIHW